MPIRAARRASSLSFRVYTWSWGCRAPVAMSTALSSTEAYSLLSLSLAAVGVLLNTFTGDGEPLIASIAFSCLAFASCYALIRWLGNAFIRRGFKGKDLCKLKQTDMYDHRTLVPNYTRSAQRSSHDPARRPWAPCVPWCTSSPS